MQGFAFHRQGCPSPCEVMAPLREASGSADNGRVVFRRPFGGLAMRVIFVVVLVLVSHVVAAIECGSRTATAAIPPDQIALTIFLVGDAGLSGKNCIHRPLCNDAVLRALQADVTARATAIGRDNVVVVYLGDNIYPEGLDTSDRRTGARLDAQVDVVRPSGVRAFFVPGNHDWQRNGVGGQARIRAQAARLAAVAAMPNGPRVALRPRDACPGPEVETFGRTASLVFVDTAWWLQPIQDRPQCGGENAALARLRDTLSGIVTPVVVVSHHPFEKSAGKHGTSGFGKQDFAGSENIRMRSKLQKAVHDSSTKPLLWAAGHDHSLELLEGGKAKFHVISGTGFVRSPSTVKCSVPGLVFGVTANGWMVLEFPVDGGAPRLEVREVPRVTPGFSRRLN